MCLGPSENCWFAHKNFAGFSKRCIEGVANVVGSFLLANFGAYSKMRKFTNFNSFYAQSSKIISFSKSLTLHTHLLTNHLVIRSNSLSMQCKIDARVNGLLFSTKYARVLPARIREVIQNMRKCVCHILCRQNIHEIDDDPTTYIRPLSILQTLSQFIT